MERDKLTEFFYVLLRDYITSGTAETIMESNIEKNPDTERQFSNHLLLALAKDLADRLR